MGGGSVECKLDRAMRNGEWNDFFPCPDANFTLPRVSNHCPYIVVTGERKKSWPTPFKFFDMWIQHEDFQQVVRDA